MGAEVLTSYTRWLECVQVKEGPEQEVYVTFSPRFERIWLESKKRLPDYVSQKPATIGLRNQYALRLYTWAKKHIEDGTKRISLEQASKGARAGVGKRRGRKDRPRSSAAVLGEFPPKSGEHCD